MSLLPGLTQSSPGVPIFSPASGGGGGGGGPNLTVSTLTVNPTGGILAPNGASFANSAMTGYTDQTNTHPTQLNVNSPTGYIGQNGGDPGLWSVLNPGPPADLYGDFGAGRFHILGPNGGTTNQIPYITAGTNSDMTIVAATSLNISTPSLLQNGAPIGGGSVPGNLNVSSLVLSGDPVASGAVLGMFANDADLYTMSVSSGTTYADLSLGTVGGRQQVYATTLEAPNFYTSTIKGATGQISLNPTGTEQIRIGGTGAPGDITIATVGGGNINLAGPVLASNAVSMQTSASVSSLTVSSINGSVYPPPAAALPISTTNLGYTQQFNSISFSGGLLQSVSTIFSSPTISTNTFFQIAGGIMGTVNIQGSGNTNPLNNSTNTGFSQFKVDLLVDEGQPSEVTLPFMNVQLTSAGNASPAQTQAWRAVSWSTINYPASYIVQSNPGLNNLYPFGQECMYLQFGKHTYKFLYGIDCFLNSGDPGAGYNLFVQWPNPVQIGNAVYQ